MARGLLISFAGYPVTVSSLFPDNGLASLAGTLITHGHEVKILDFNTTEILQEIVTKKISDTLTSLLPALSTHSAPNCLSKLLDINHLLEMRLEEVSLNIAKTIKKHIEDQQINFIGFKLWSGYGFIASLQIAKYLRKQFPNIKIYAGGPAVLYSGETIFDHTIVFDALVDGEGEEAIVGLADHSDGAKKLGEIPNLIFIQNEKIHKTERCFITNLDALAKPIYEPQIYPSLKGDNHIKVFVLDESRGCPSKCNFCVHSIASGKRWRTKSPKRIFEEIVAIQNCFSVSTIRLGGSYTPISIYDQLSDQLLQLKDKIRIRFSGFAHPSTLNTPVLKKLADAGCISLFLGIESFDRNDQEVLGKRINPSHSKKIIRDCIKLGIAPTISLIVPLPNQTDRSIQTNRDIAIDLCENNISSIVTQFPALLPNTKWWKEREKYGFQLQIPEDEYLKNIALYKIRSIIPPQFWESPQYVINGINFEGFATKNAKFQVELIKRNVVVNIPDEIMLLFDSSKETLIEFRKKIQTYFFTLSADKIMQFTKASNNYIKV